MNENNFVHTTIVAAAYKRANANLVAHMDEVLAAFSGDALAEVAGNPQSALLETTPPEHLRLLGRLATLFMAEQGGRLALAKAMRELLQKETGQQFVPHVVVERLMRALYDVPQAVERKQAAQAADVVGRFQASAEAMHHLADALVQTPLGRRCMDAIVRLTEQPVVKAELPDNLDDLSPALQDQEYAAVRDLLAACEYPAGKLLHYRLLQLGCYVLAMRANADLLNDPGAIAAHNEAQAR